MKCYTTLWKEDSAELTEARANIKIALNDIGGERAKRLADDLWTLENEISSRACIQGYEDAMTVTLPLLTARKLIELIAKREITEAEALAALEVKSTRHKEQLKPEAVAA